MVLGDTVVELCVLLRHSRRVVGSIPGQGPCCVEFARSPCVSVGSPASLHSPKNMHVGRVGSFKLNVGERVSASVCLSFRGSVMNSSRVSPCLHQIEIETPADPGLSRYQYHDDDTSVIISQYQIQSDIS